MIKKTSILLATAISFSYGSLISNVVNANTTSETEQQTEQILVKNPVIKYNSATKSAAVYFTLENKTDSELTLVSVDALELATGSEFHKTITESNGVVKMEKQKDFIIPAHGELIFESGKTHVMLTGIKDLEPENQISLQLTFIEINPQTIIAKIEK